VRQHMGGAFEYQATDAQERSAMNQVVARRQTVAGGAPGPLARWPGRGCWPGPPGGLATTVPWCTGC
jgi:hypothetical protein